MQLALCSLPDGFLPTVQLNGRGGGGRGRIGGGGGEEVTTWARDLQTTHWWLLLFLTLVYTDLNYVQTIFKKSMHCPLRTTGPLFRSTQNNSLLILSYLSRSLADRWGTTVDFTTSFLHSSRFSAFRSVMFPSRPVHSLMLSSHRFLCLPLRLPP